MYCDNLIKKEVKIHLNLNYQEIQGDGHCLYNAVALYLGSDKEELRHLVADSVQQLITENNEDVLSVIMANLPQNSTIEEYIEAIRNGNEWADQLEIITLMEILQRPIVIVNIDGSVRNEKDIEKFINKEPIFVFYNGINHYDALLLIGNKPPNAILNDLLKKEKYSLLTSTEVLNMEEKLKLSQKIINLDDNETDNTDDDIGQGLFFRTKPQLFFKQPKKEKPMIQEKKEVQNEKFSDVNTLIFEGGSVKGLAYVGALQTMDTYCKHKTGNSFLNQISHAAGTSAGAIMSLLIAIGLDLEQIRIVMEKTSFSSFADMGWFASKSHIGKGVNLYNKGYLCEGNVFMIWVEQLLDRYIEGGKNITFEGLANQKGKENKLGGTIKGLSVYAVRLNDGEIIEFCAEKTPKVPVALAVRMSMSIPVYFKPVRVEENLVNEKLYLQLDEESGKTYYVDGGVKANYPYKWLKESRDLEPNQILGFKVGTDLERLKEIKGDNKGLNELYMKTTQINSGYGPSLIPQMISVLMSPQDDEHNKDEEAKSRTIHCSDCGISTFAFNLNEKDIEKLLISGSYAATRFLSDTKQKIDIKQEIIIPNVKEENKFLKEYKETEQKRINEITKEISQLDNKEEFNEYIEGINKDSKRIENVTVVFKGKIENLEYLGYSSFVGLETTPGSLNELKGDFTNKTTFAENVSFDKPVKFEGINFKGMVLKSNQQMNKEQLEKKQCELLISQAEKSLHNLEISFNQCEQAIKMKTYWKTTIKGNELDYWKSNLKNLKLNVKIEKVSVIENFAKELEKRQQYEEALSKAYKCFNKLLDNCKNEGESSVTNKKELEEWLMKINEYAKEFREENFSQLNELQKLLQKKVEEIENKEIKNMFNF